MDTSTLGYFLILGLIAIGTIVALIYTLRHRILTLRQWGIAILSSLGWGLGLFIGYLLFLEKWNHLISYISSGNYVEELLWEVQITDYYSLAISGILAALLGVAILYLLMRYLPSNKAG